MSLSLALRSGVWLATMLALQACSEAVNSTGMISQRIGDVVRTPGATQVDLGALTTFGWDRVYAFPPGATRQQMCDFVGAGRTTCGRVIRVERTPEGHVAMVYDLQGQVTHFEFHALANGRFDVAFGQQGIPRSAAIFRIRWHLGTDEVWLEPR